MFSGTEHSLYSPGVKMAHKAMLMCSFVPGIDGQGKIELLSSEIRKLVQENMQYFDDQDPAK